MPGRAIDDGGAGVVDEVADLARCVRGVQREKDRPDPKACEVERDVVGGLVDLHHDAVTDNHPEITQNSSHASGTKIDVSIRESWPVGDSQERRIESRREAFGEGGVQVGHGAVSSGEDAVRRSPPHRTGRAGLERGVLTAGVSSSS